MDKLSQLDKKRRTLRSKAVVAQQIGHSVMLCDFKLQFWNCACWVLMLGGFEVGSCEATTWGGGGGGLQTSSAIARNGRLKDIKRRGALALHCRHLGKLLPPPLKTKISHEFIPHEVNPPPPCPLYFCTNYPNFSPSFTTHQQTNAVNSTSSTHVTCSVPDKQLCPHKCVGQ